MEVEKLLPPDVGQVIARIFCIAEGIPVYGPSFSERGVLEERIAAGGAWAGRLREIALAASETDEFPGQQARQALSRADVSPFARLRGTAHIAVKCGEPQRGLLVVADQLGANVEPIGFERPSPFPGSLPWLDRPIPRIQTAALSDETAVEAIHDFIREIVALVIRGSAAGHERGMALALIEIVELLGFKHNQA